MLRMALAQVMRRRGRSLAVVSAIVVAAVSFSLLTSAVATSTLRVQGTVDENFRTSYDILVRPPSSRSGLERSEGLVQENYLSGIFGGISMRQYRTIAEIPAVDVAAPVAMVGYILPAVYLGVRIDDLVTGARQQLYRVKRTWESDRGLSTYPDRDTYIYVTRQPVTYGGDQYGPSQRDPVTGKTLSICQSFLERHDNTAKSAFDLRRLTELSCFSTNPPQPGRPFNQLDHGKVGFGLVYPFPMLIAAIDPVQEAKLVGLDDAMVTGRYLTADDRTRLKGNFNQIPVLMANKPLTDDLLETRIQRVRVGDQRRLPGRLAAKDALRWLSTRPADTLRTTTVTDLDMYPRVLKAYTRDVGTAQVNYWDTSQVDYRRMASGELQPEPMRAPAPETWFDPLSGGYAAPKANADTAYRRLHQHLGSTSYVTGAYGSPNFKQVGVFDPNNITGFSELSEVPLTTYYPPSAAPADEASRRLLRGQSLAPNANLAGYLQQPPMMLTTLRSLPSLTDPQAFSDISPATTKAPISVIRVRVSGVTGADELSQARVRLVAEQIARQTGLDVDITIGSSPTPELINLPAGQYGRPELTLREGWVSKGVTVQLLSAVDRKSLAIFGLVLLVCLLFLVNATVAAVRIRRTELGVLACLGWPARRIFGLLQAELVATGVLAGLIGTTIAAALVYSLDLQVAWVQLALITPVATLLAAAAGIGPAWRASRALPIEAIQPAVRAPRRAANVASIGRLAVVGVWRWPGRTVLGAASLFIGVAAMAVLISVQQAFQGGVTGTLLGDVVAVQVRGVDYLAAGLTIALGGFAIADIAYLNISERTGEIGTLRATGWGDNHLRRLFGTEAILTAAIGAVSGAIVGVTATAVLLPVDLATTLTAAATAAAGGIVAAAVALAVPLRRLNTLAPSLAVNIE